MGNGHAAATAGRKRALELRAADARALLSAKLPYVLPHITTAQLQSVQKVFDAAVVNPAVQKDYAVALQRSVRSQHGSLVHRDPDMVRQADRILDDLIEVTEADRRIRLDFQKLLAPDALESKTDNPDETAYFKKVRNTLSERGVWLRIGQPFVRNPENPSSHIVDPRVFEVWLSIGPDGDTIPTKTGQLDRETLLGTTLFGAGYYREVSQGRVQSLLDEAIRSLRSQISTGETLHDMQEEARRRARPGVVAVSDALGRANYPSKAIWDGPHELVLKAMRQNTNGDISKSSRTLIAASYLTEAAANRLHKYIEATTTGAQRAVKILTVAKIAGIVAESVLVIRAIVTGIIRLLAAEGAAETGAAAARTTTAAKDHSPAAYYPTNYNARVAWEKTINQSGITIQSGEFGTAINRYDTAFRARHKSCTEEIVGWLAKNQQAPFDQKVGMIEAINKKWWGSIWGGPLPGD